ADNLVHRIDDSDRSDPLGGIETETIVELSIRNQRIASAPIECDGILATPETDGRLDVWCTSQGVQSMRNQLAQLLGLDVDRMRVRSAAVGGGFGGRASAIPEFVVVIALARELGRPIRWVQDRYENLTGMAQGRGYESMMRVGLDANLAMTGLDVDLVADAGSSAHVAGLLMVSVRRQATGLYRVPALRWSGSCVLSTTTPVGAYRGAGQPEANHARERLLDAIARRVGVDPIEFRRHNLATADEFPLPTLGGVTY
ncbi:MAG: molybdopterin-dependent oxidoreductase, partial [Actinomycetia bacterium]|nr:molybdopterin-dependent oxidoreductase [Actinomycetes bacterium]